MTNKINLPIRIFILFATLTAVAFPTVSASARLAKCRTDPIFYLSNGEKVTIILYIDAEESNVQNVNYVLHVPAGVNVTKVVFTAGGVGRKETYKSVQDSPNSTYTTETTVTTRGGPFAVTATSSLTSGVIASASGFNGDLLVVTLVQTQAALRK
jgi:hypothetical protein